MSACATYGAAARSTRRIAGFANAAVVPAKRPAKRGEAQCVTAASALCVAVVTNEKFNDIHPLRNL
jgi:hypothetical protein